MVKSRKNFFDLLYSHSGESFVSENVRKTVMANVFGVIGLFTLIFFVTNAYINQQWLSFYFMFVFSLIFIAILVYLRVFPSRYKQVSYFIIALVYMVSVFLFINPDIGVRGLAWHFAFIPISFMLLGHRKAVYYNSFLFVSIFMLYTFTSSVGQIISFDILWRYAFIFLVLTFILSFYEYVRFRTHSELITIQNSLHQSLEQLTEQNEEMEVQSDMLEQFNSELQKFSLIAKKTENSVMILDDKGEVQWANEAFCKLFGYQPTELSKENRNVFNLTNCTDLIDIWSNCIRSGQTISYESARLSKHDKLVYLQSTLTPMLDESGKVIMLALIDTDISKQKSVEKKLTQLNQTLEKRVSEELKANREKDVILIQQNRQAALGDLLSNIAHQWRQPLSAVGLNIQNIQDAYLFGELSNEYLHERVKKCMHLVDHMSQTIDDFRMFVEPDKQKHQFCVNRVIHKTVAFIEPTFQELGIDIEIHGGKDIFVYGFSNEYMQVVLNILYNAKDFLDEEKIEKPVVKIEINEVKDGCEVIVFNNGPQIDDQVAHRIFDPYFTTKEVNKGSGLGLYIAKNIIEFNMNGRLWFRNQEGGVEFIIRI